jgi:hypothetical protein
MYCWEEKDRCNDCPIDYSDKICPLYKDNRISSKDLDDNCIESINNNFLDLL